ncbi:hypothetical protein [Carnimonas bestiolae]|uniref:hypothetical protein n=1 Tax=Carnimonas bestiolae TaxID=3402172 RepID=UPI003EDC918B
MKTAIELDADDIELLTTIIEGAMGEDAGKQPTYQRLMMAKRWFERMGELETEEWI